jgi:Predicted membrane protein/domain
MATNVVDRERVRASRPIERVVDFDPVLVAAPFVLRCGSLLADYLLVIVIPAGFLLISRASGNDGSSLINSGFNDIGWLTGILIGFVSFLILPVATGKSFGKMVTGLRIVSIDGTEPSVRRIIVRQLVAGVLFLLTAGLSFFFSAFSSKGRALHDYIAGTTVIYADKQTR